MRMWKTLWAGAVIMTFLATSQAWAQQITGTPGSPGATTTIPGTQLPQPDPKFGGIIKNDALQSKPWWAPRVVAPKSPVLRQNIVSPSRLGNTDSTPRLPDVGRAPAGMI